MAKWSIIQQYKKENLEMTKQRGDRKDGHLVHSDDPMHIFMPYIMGSRTDNEALLNATFDMTAVTE